MSKTHNNRNPRIFVLFALALLMMQCSQQFAVSVNNQSVFDPNRRLRGAQVVDANLQGCINIAMRQQAVDDIADLRILSCANSEVVSLDNIQQFRQLRFLDLGNNSIVDLSPLQALNELSGLNLMNNLISDISPLLGIASLTSLSVAGNNAIGCDQLDVFETRMGENLSRPIICQR